MSSDNFGGNLDKWALKTLWIWLPFRALFILIREVWHKMTRKDWGKDARK